MEQGVSAGARTPLAVSHWSTGGISPARRFAVWSARSWPSLAQLFDSTPIDPFRTSVDHVVLGAVMVQFATGTARRYVRTTQRLRVDGVEMLGLCILLSGEITGMAADRAFAAGPGGIVLLDLAQPSDHLLSTAESIQIGIPRDLAERHLGSVDALHGTVVGPADAALVVDHLLRLRAALPRLAQAQGPRLGRVLLDLIAIALGHDEEALSPAPPATMRAAAEAAIERRLGEHPLTAAVLGADLGISRGTLFRLFKADGGFQAYARERRLDQVRRALDVPGDRTSIAVLADRWGFSDAPHLSRQFRAKFGVTPGAYRAAVTTGRTD